MRLAPWALVAALLAPHLAAAQTCPTVSYPGAEWTDVSTATATARPEAIAALEAHAFEVKEPIADRKGYRTEGLVIIKGGELVYEKYGRGWGPTNKHLAWSVTKSITGVLTGVAAEEGHLALTDSICDHLDFVPDANCDIEVQHLLEFASGLDWKEIYEGESNQESSTLAMLYGQGSADMAKFVASHPKRDPPGTSFQYSTGETTLLANVVSAALTPAHGDDWPWKALFDPIGMQHVTWERDAAGTPVGGSYVWTTPRDLARVGYLMQQDGCWDGTRLLPEGYVASATSVSDTFRNAADGKLVDNADYDVNGRQFWLNVDVPEQGVTKRWPSLPDDTFAALGHWGQFIIVIPSRDFILVRTGDDRDGDIEGPERNAWRGTLIELGLEVAGP